MRHNTLTIPPNTRLLSIERIPWDTLGYEWAIWMHTNETELAKEHAARNGTYLRLNSDGSVHRVTVDGDTTTEMEVME